MPVSNTFFSVLKGPDHLIMLEFIFVLAAGHSWNRLPPIMPVQIAIARQIKKLFTGKLDAPVSTRPVDQLLSRNVTFSVKQQK